MIEEIRQALETALERDEFRLGYQPQVDLRTGRIVGVEALLRMKGYSPAEFIPVAEDAGLIEPIGRWLVSEAVRQLAEWDATGLPGLHMSVNLSQRQLINGFVPTIVEALDAHKVSRSRVTVELTETVIMTSPAAMAELYMLTETGVYVAIDDFGTGYSSLAYLRELPVEILKVDRSFVSGRTNGRLDLPVVNAVLTLADTMGLHVVAEGIETDDQACALAVIGCHIGQGFRFSPALPPERIPIVVREGYDPGAWQRVSPGARAFVVHLFRMIGHFYRNAGVEWHRQALTERRTLDVSRPPPWGE